jgi:hypothetical protein
MLSRAELTEYVRRLGLEFARRGMPEVEILVQYFQALETDSLDQLPAMHVFWNEETTMEWMKTLQVPPFEESYPVRSFASRCAACNGVPHRSFSEVVFPGGARVRCERCNDVWIETELER